MRKMPMLVLAILLIANLCNAQTCANFTTLFTNAPWDPSGNQGHLTGQHSWLTNSASSCTYSSVGAQYCASACSAYGSSFSSETGTLSNILLDHEVNSSVNPGNSSSNGAQIMCASTTAVTAVSCLVGTSCAVTIKFSGSANGIGIDVDFPEKAIFAESNANSTTCVARLDPTYSTPGGGGCEVIGPDGKNGTQDSCGGNSEDCPPLGDGGNSACCDQCPTCTNCLDDDTLRSKSHGKFFNLSALDKKN